jgi:hypothetical protein
MRICNLLADSGPSLRFKERGGEGTSVRVASPARQLRKATMTSRFDYARAYYWRIQFIETDDPDDDRYVVLHGEEGEIVGPMTMALAQAWMRYFRAPQRMHEASVLLALRIDRR